MLLLTAGLSDHKFYISQTVKNNLILEMQKEKNSPIVRPLF
jgi:hypothetical protein